MLNRIRFSTCATVASVSVLAACSTPDNTITQSYQLERALVERAKFDCPYRYITDSVGQQIILQDDGDEIIALLRENCPDLASYFAETDNGFVFASNSLDDGLTLPSDERTNENVPDNRGPINGGNTPEPKGEKPGNEGPADEGPADEGPADEGPEDKGPSDEQPSGGFSGDPGNPKR